MGVDCSRFSKLSNPFLSTPRPLVCLHWQTITNMMIHSSPWLYVRSILSFLESVPQCPQAAETAQHVKQRFLLTIAHMQLNEAEQQPWNCHLLWSHIKQPKCRLKWQSITPESDCGAWRQHRCTCINRPHHKPPFHLNTQRHRHSCASFVTRFLRDRWENTCCTWCLLSQSGGTLRPFFSTVVGLCRVEWVSAWQEY